MLSNSLWSLTVRTGVQIDFRSNPYTPRQLFARFGRAQHRQVVVASGETGKGNEDEGEATDVGIINEDMIARLKKSEEEAESLRKELYKARGGEKPMDAFAKDAAKKGPVQNEARESLYELSSIEVQRKTGLSETDVDFLIGESDTEGSTKGVTEEEEAIIQRRLLISLGAAAALGVFAFIPPDLIHFRPSQPLKTFLVPILRATDLLEECGPLIENAEWNQVALVLDRVQKSPNNIKENLEGAVGYMNTREERQRGSFLVQETMEHLEQVDYKKYFSDLGRLSQEGGQKNAEYVSFSSQALNATKGSLNSFLSLLPPEEIGIARQSIPSSD